jgi:hypothetical protein
MTQQLPVSFECSPVREITVDAADRSPVSAIVETVAEFEDADPTEMEPLARYIDTDVVTGLVEGRTVERECPAGLCFTYGEWNVFVRADGTVIIGDPADLSRQTPLF